MNTPTNLAPDRQHPAVRHPHVSINTALGDRINGVFGSMATFWVLIAWQIGWMVLATLGVAPFNEDKYPFVFCLFLSNLIQLWALPVLGNTSNRADLKRTAKADADHRALTHLALVADATARRVDATEQLLEDIAAHLGVATDGQAGYASAFSASPPGPEPSGEAT